MRVAPRPRPKKFLSTNLCIVSNVYGKSRMKKLFQFETCGRGLPVFESFADLVFIGVLIFKLNAKHGLSFGSLTNADKCSSVHLWVGVENTLTRYGKESLGMEFDPVAFAPTEPKSALGIKIPKSPIRWRTTPASLILRVLCCCRR